MKAEMTTVEDIRQLMRQNKKFLPMSRPSVYITFVISLLGVFPLWLLVLLPSATVSQLLLWLLRKLLGSKAPKSTGEQRGLPDPLRSNRREYDVVVYGATGFTGRLAVNYLATQYGNKVKWAICGRRRNVLEAMQTQLAASSLEIPIIVADADDRTAMSAMARSTKVVIALAGPFSKCGSLLVQLCAENGTDYVDITGEVSWVKHMINEHDALARQTGARIVHMCGHDCVPWDLAVMELATALKERKDELVEVSCFDEAVAAPSGGTIATMIHEMSKEKKQKIPAPAAETKTEYTASNQLLLGYSKLHRSWVGPSVMAPIMSWCVGRSHTLLGYSSKLVYREAQVYSGFCAGFAQIVGLLASVTALGIPPLRWFLLKTHLLPQPGEGPSPKQMDRGFLLITAVGRGAKGTQSTATFYFPTDPGYRDTARMAVESGLTLALEGNKLTCGGGVFTPAAALGRVLLARLIATGSKFCLR